jgi:hypothetical protein
LLLKVVQGVRQLRIRPRIIHDHCMDIHEVEDDRCSPISVKVDRIGDQLVACTDHLPLVAHIASSHVLEEMEFLPVFGVIADSRISAEEEHVALLPFSGVAKNPLRSPSIVVSILFSALARKHKDIGVLDRGADSPLGLAAKL